jgi:hypothetical protein
MKFDLQNKDGLTLKTKCKIVKEDIAVGLSENDKSALVPENMRAKATVLGVQGGIPDYDGSYEGDAEAANIMDVNIGRIKYYHKMMDTQTGSTITLTDEEYMARELRCQVLYARIMEV